MEGFFIRLRKNQSNWLSQSKYSELYFSWAVEKQQLMVLVHCKSILAGPTLSATYWIVIDTPALHFIEPYQRQRI